MLMPKTHSSALAAPDQRMRLLLCLGFTCRDPTLLHVPFDGAYTMLRSAKVVPVCQTA